MVDRFIHLFALSSHSRHEHLERRADDLRDDLEQMISTSQTQEKEGWRRPVLSLRPRSALDQGCLIRNVHCRHAECGRRSRHWAVCHPS